MKLLIVDDHAPTRNWLRTSLSDLAAEISESTDGSAAIEKYAEEQPDCVVMDFEMKPMNGLVATRMIRQRFPNARIVMVTNHQESWLRDAALEAGAAEFLPKEDLWQLREHLKSACS